MLCQKCELGCGTWPNVVKLDSKNSWRKDHQTYANNIGVRGRLDAQVLVLGSQPVEYDQQHAGAFSGVMGTTITEWLRAGKLIPEDLCYAYTVRCRPVPNMAAEQRHVLTCADAYLYDLLESMPNLKVILAMGNAANWALHVIDDYNRGLPVATKPDKAVPSGIMAARGIEWVMKDGILVMPTLNPLQVLLKLNLVNTLIGDIRKVGYLLSGGASYKSKTSYYNVNTPESVREMFDRLKEAKHFVWDTETTTLELPREDDHFLCIQFSTQEGEGYYLPMWENSTNDYNWSPTNSEIPQSALIQKSALKNYWITNYGEQAWTDVLSQLREVMESEEITKTGHNIMFDARMLWHMLGIECHNFKCDTMIAHALIDQDALHGLKELANNYTDMGAYDRELDMVFNCIKDACDKHNNGLKRRVEKVKQELYARLDAELHPEYTQWLERKKACVKSVCARIRKEEGVTAKEYPTSGKLTATADPVFHKDFWDAVNADVYAKVGDAPEYNPDVTQAEFDVEWPKVAESLGGDKPLEANYSMLPLSMLRLYACKDVDATIRLENILVPELDRLGQMTPWGGYSSLLTIHDAIMMPLLHTLVEASVIGVPLDIELTKETSIKLQAEAQKTNERIQRDMSFLGVEVPVDLSSTPKLVDVLFNQLNLPVIERSLKTGIPSSGKKILHQITKRLEGLIDADDKDLYCNKFRDEKTGEYMPPVELNKLIDLYEDKRRSTVILRMLKDIEEFRGAMQRDSTFAQGFLNAVYSDGCLHPTYKLSRDETGKGTATGRLATSNPNLLNLPRTSDDDDSAVLEAGRAIRRQIIPHTYSTGRGVIIDYDLSQAEVRVGGSLAKDVALRKMVEDNVDIHSLVASKVPGFGLQQYTPAEIKKMTKQDTAVYQKRTKAKTALFGTMYGQAARGFAKDPEFGANEAEAQEIIDTIFSLMPSLRSWIERQKDFAVKHGYIVTPWGRRRLLKDSQNMRSDIQKSALRAAVNSPVQAHASDYCLLAMVQAWQNIRGYYAGEDTLYTFVDDDGNEVTENLAFLGGDGICKATGKAYQSRPILIVHDNVIISAPVEEGEEVSQMLNHYMRMQLPSHYIKMSCEGGTLDRWAGNEVDVKATLEGRLTGSLGLTDYIYTK